MNHYGYFIATMITLPRKIKPTWEAESDLINENNIST